MNAKNDEPVEFELGHDPDETRKAALVAEILGKPARGYIVIGLEADGHQVAGFDSNVHQPEGVLHDLQDVGLLLLVAAQLQAALRGRPASAEPELAGAGSPGYL